MGFFSWLTADTKRSLSVFSNRPSYLLQPNGKPPISTDTYDGFGNFGDTNAMRTFRPQKLARIRE